MANPLFSPLEFDFYYADKVIGTLHVDVNPKGEYIFELDVTDDTHLPWGFHDSNEEFISKGKDQQLHRKIIKNWLEERVFPPERHNADELLSDIGLTEYDLLAVLKSTNAKSRYDHFWIDFNNSNS